MSEALLAGESNGGNAPFDGQPFGMELAEGLPPAVNMMRGPTPTFDNPAGDTCMFDAN